MEVSSMPQTRFFLPRRIRLALYRKKGGHWYRALIRNARNRAGELGRIDARLADDQEVSGVYRRVLRRRIRRYLKTAEPDPPARSPALEVLRQSGCIEDTTEYEDPGTTLT